MSRNTPRATMVLTAAFLGLCSHPSWAIEMRLGANADRTQGRLVLDVSQTGHASVFLKMEITDGNLSFIDLYFDATPVRDRRARGYTLEGTEFLMTREAGDPWYRAVRNDHGGNIEAFAGVYADDPPGGPIGTNGTGTPTWYEVDRLILHGREVGEYRLYFENEFTSEGSPRPPRLLNRLGVEKDFVWFSNAWHEESGERPFFITVVPEPGAAALTALLALCLLGPRRTPAR